MDLNKFYELDKDRMLKLLKLAEDAEIVKSEYKKHCLEGRTTVLQCLIDTIFGYRKWYDIECLTYFPIEMLRDFFMGRIACSINLLPDLNNEYIIYYQEDLEKILQKLEDINND